MIENNMQCYNIEMYFDGEITGKSLIQFETHLQKCEDCKVLVEDWNVAKNAYSNWVNRQTDFIPLIPQDAEVSEFTSVLAEKLEAQKINSLPKKKTTRKNVIFWAAAALVIGIFSILVFRERTSLQVSSKTVVSTNATTDSIIETTTDLWIPIVRFGNKIKKENILKVTVKNPLPITLAVDSFDRLLASPGNDVIGLDKGGLLNIESVDNKKTVLSLKKGTVACSVAPRSYGKHFFVKAGDVLVTVVGTRFAVTMNNQNNVTVSVVKGTVQVSYGKSTVLLTGGFTVSVKEGIISKVNNVSEVTVANLSRLLSKEIIDSQLESRDDVSSGQSGKPLQNKSIGPKRAGRDLAKWRSLIINGQVEEAFTQISRYLGTSQKDAEAMMLQAMCQKKMRRFKDAVKTYRIVSRLSDAGEANQARYFAGEICQSQLGDHSGAIEMFRQYLENTSKGSANRAEAKLRLAKSLLKLNESFRAKKMLIDIIDNNGRATVANRARAILEANP